MTLTSPVRASSRRARRTCAIGTPVGGVVTELDHWIGDKVKAGDALFRIDRAGPGRGVESSASGVWCRPGRTSRRPTRRPANCSRSSRRCRDLVQAKVVSKEECERRQFAATNARREVGPGPKADVASSGVADQPDADRAGPADRARACRRDGAAVQDPPRRVRPGRDGRPAPDAGRDTTDLNVRVDVDENDAWRVQTDKPAVAYVRGNRDLKTNLKFVRVEPLVVPKKSLTGDSCRAGRHPRAAGAVQLRPQVAAQRLRGPADGRVHRGPPDRQVMDVMTAEKFERARFDLPNKCRRVTTVSVIGHWSFVIDFSFEFRHSECSLRSLLVPNEKRLRRDPCGRRRADERCHRPGAWSG